MNEAIELSAREMEIIMLCIRGEYESVEGEADTLHDKLADEGFDFSGNTQSAKLIPSA